MKRFTFSHSLSGSLFTLALSILVLYFFFGELLRSPNSVYFAEGGDGLQSYYGTMYHISHDTSYARSGGMNYPYGEMVLFTSNQPVIANTIKFISDNIIDISAYTIGILNILMLSSIVVAALFVFLIFRHFKLPVLLSVILSVAIPFLSPQIGRLGGHFSLSYVFVIPLMIYLLILFYERRSLTISLLIGLATLLAAFTHFYFLGFYGLLLFFFWLVLIVKEKDRFGKSRFFLLHIFVQIILPVVLVLIYALINDPVTDRTTSPWGILYLRAYPESVFLPVGKPYGKFLEKIMTFNHIDWEGWAYTGLVAVAGFMIVLIKIFRRFVRKEYLLILKITDKPLLNILFWASFAGLLYSFGLPFILGMEGLLDYLGPIRQMRGIARFSWLFFYIMNIVTFYLLWNWFSERRDKVLSWLIMIFLVVFVCYDAWLNSRSMEYYMNNHIPMLDDRDNALPDNQWVHEINPGNYQSIIPLPYFHIGSENLWIHPKCEILKYTYTASLKTGLPTTGVLLSRTSLGQSFRNIEMMLEPYRKPEILDDLPNNKPFLLLAAKCDELNDNEKRLLSEAEFITGNEMFSLYSLPVNKLRKLASSMAEKVKQEIEETDLKLQGDFMVKDSSLYFYYDGYGKEEGNLAYHGNYGYEGVLSDYNTLFWDRLPVSGTDSVFVVSFWLGNARKDLISRSTIEFAWTDSTDQVIRTEYRLIGNLYALLDGNWALVEHKIEMRDMEFKIKITVWNKELRKEKLIVDELLIRHSFQDIYQKYYNGIAKNNRFYSRVPFRKYFR